MKVLSIDRVRFGAFEFDRLNRLLYREGAELSLPPRAIAVLSSLIDRPGQIVPKQVLLDEVWKDANVTETSLTEAVSLLRQALSDDPQRPSFIQTVPRRGYRFVAPAEFVDDAPAAGSNGAGMAHGAVAAAAITRGTDAEALAAWPRAALTESTVPSAAAQWAATRGAEDVASMAPLAQHHQPGVALTPATADPTWPAWLPWLFLGVALVVFSGIVAPLVRRPSTYARPVVRFAVEVPAGLRLVGEGPAIAVSRDGRRVAFVAQRGDGLARIYVRDMDRLDPVVLDGTDGAAAPFFSPDARWVGFFADGSLKKVPVGGGAPVTLCAARMPLGAVWSTRRFIVFASSLTGGLSRVHEDGGRAASMTTPDPEEGEVRHAWPDMLPDEGGVIFTGVPLTGGPEASRIAALTFESDRVQTLVSAGVSPHVVPTGHLLFARNRTVFAAPFDPDARELLGPALPVLDDVVTDDASGATQFAAAPGGHTAVVRVARPETTAVYEWRPLGALATSGATAPRDAAATQRASQATHAAGAARPFTAPFPAREIRGLSLSPDGARLAVSLGDGHRTDIWVTDLARGDLQRLTSDGQNVAPIWTPDSQRIVYASRRADGPFTMLMKTIDEPAASSTAMHVTARQPLPASASAAGLVYVDAQPSTGLDLWLLPWNGGAATPLVQTPFDEAAGAISPNGRWLAYQSNESGSWMVTLRRLDVDSSSAAAPAAANANVNDAVAASLAPSDGSRIAWTPDSQSILFTHDGLLQQVAVPTSQNRPAPHAALPPASGGPTPPQPAAPRILASDVDAASGFGLTRDGRLFLRTREASAAPARFEVVLDWSRELSARVPIRPRPPKPVR